MPGPEPSALHAPVAPRWTSLAAIAITLFAAALRMLGLADFWLNPDEGIYFSVIAWPELAQRQAEIAANAHPPLFYHLLWLWSRVSMDFAWLRALPALMGTLSVWGVYRLGCAVGGTHGVATGLLAAFLLAIAPAAITLSQVIRPYTLQMALLVFALLGLVRWHDSGKRGALAMFSVCAAIAVLTHYSSVFVLAAAAAPLGVQLRRRKLRAGAGAQLALAAALPLLAAAAVYGTHVATQLAGTPLHTRAFTTWLRPHLADSLPMVWRQLLGVLGYTFGDPWSGSGVAAVLLSCALACRQRAWRIALVPLLLLAAAMTASLLHLYPFGPGRHSAYLIPFLLLPIAWAGAQAICVPGRLRYLTLAVAAVLLLARAQLYDVLSGGLRISTLGSEKVLCRSDMQKVRDVLTRVQASQGPVLISDDTYHTLCPLWQREREGAVTTADWRRFRWGNRDVLASSQWEFSMQGHDLGKGRHVLDVLQAADAAFPDLGVAARHDLTMLFAGFHVITAQALAQYDQSRGAQPRLLRNAVGWPGFAHLELDVARFLAEARAELEAMRAQPSGR